MAERKQFDVPIEALLRRRVTGGLIVAVLLTVFLSFWSWHGARRAEQDAYWVSHTYEVMATIQATARDVLEAETSARAFALIGQEPLLVHYQTARGNIYQDEDTLRHLTADNLSQQRRLDVLEPLVRTALEFAESIIAKRRQLGAYPGGSDALEIERLVVAVRATTQDMHAEETRLLSQRTQSAAAGQWLTRIVAVAGLFLEIGLWSLAFLVVIREIAVSARARSQLNTLNVELEQRVEERTAALRESEERFHAMANGIPQLAHMAGPDGAFSWYNDRWYQYTGTTPDQMEGWGWRGVIDPSMLLKVMKRWQASIATSEPFDMEFPLRGADGTFRTFLNRVMPLKDSEGRVVRWFGTNTDISEHKEAQELLAAQAQELSVSREALEAQTRMFQLVLDSMGEGLIAADRDGHFLIWNDSAKKLMGRDASDLPSEQWTPYYQVFLSDGITPCPPDRLPLVRALHGESVQVEMMVQQPGRAEGVFLEVSARPLKDDHGNLGGGVAVLRDITERKTAEREVQALNQTLETRVIERTAELKVSNKELEAFTYSVSHDLRAPIRHISGFAKILVEKFRSSLPAEGHEHLQLIVQAAHRMGQMVDEMLKLARLGRQALEVKTTGLSSLAADVVTLLAPEIGGRQVEWKIDELPFVECDPTLMRQVFQNLISNALKYSRPRSPAVIEIGQTEKEGEKVIFVKDNGVGFDMEYSDKLFGVFQRLHLAEEFEGNGIGLATV